MTFNSSFIHKISYGIVAMFLVTTLSTVVSPSVHAQVVGPDLPSQYTLLEPLPCIPGNGVVCEAGTQKTTVNFKEYIQYAFNLVIALAAVAAVFMIVWGGFQYMTSDAWSQKSEGIKKARTAVYGLLLVLCSYLILRTIDPRLVEIPDTLVPKLELKYDKNTVSKFFNDVAEEADQYGFKVDELQRASVTSKENAERAMIDLEDLYDEYAEMERAGTLTEQDMAMFHERQAKIEDDIQKNLSTGTSQQYSTILAIQERQAAELTPDNSDSKQELTEHLAGLRGNVERWYSTGLAKLQGVSNPADPEAAKALLDAKNSALQTIANKEAEYGIKKK
jgi:hypothetical protein